MSDVAARNARNRAKGKEWERDLREGLRGADQDVEALKLHGTTDEGDMLVRLELPPTYNRVVVEAKNAARLSLAAWVAEAMTEADHYTTHRGLRRDKVMAVVIAKRPRLNWRKAFVVTTVEEFFHLDKG